MADGPGATTNRRRATVQVTIELGSSVTSLKAPLATERSWHALEGALEGVMDEVGLSGIVRVSVAVTDSFRALGIRVNGRLQPYPPLLLRRVWLTVAPPDLSDLALAGDQRGQHPDWFVDYVARAGAADPPEWVTAVSFIHQLVLEVVRQRPTCLLGPAQVAAFLRDWHAPYPGPLPTERLLIVLKHLLDLGLNVADHSAIFQAIDYAIRLDESAEATAEAAFSSLRPPTIQLRVHPDILRSVVKVNVPDTGWSVHAKEFPEEIRSQWVEFEKPFFDGWGIRLPTIELIPTPGLQAGTMTVKINDVPSLALPIPSGDEIAVAAARADLESIGITGRPTLLAAGGAPIMIVGEASSPAVVAAGFRVWTALGFVQQVLATAAYESLGRFLAVEDVDAALAELNNGFPALVSAALVTLAPEDLTRAMRGLLDEGLSIRDFRETLELLLRYSTIRGDPDAFVILDDRLTVSDDDPAPLWARYLRFLRLRLPSARVLDTADVLFAFRLVGEAPVTESEAEALRHEIWSKLETLQPLSSPPAIVTRSSDRLGVRDLLNPELRQLPVFAQSELPVGLKVEWLGTIPARVEELGAAATPQPGIEVTPG